MKIYYIVYLIFLFAVTSCSPQSRSENLPPLPDVGIAPDTLNNDLALSTTKSWNTFKKNEKIVLDVHLRTDIMVKDDFDVEIFMLSEDGAKWIEVPKFNKELSSITFTGSDDIILSAENPNTTLIIRPVIGEEVEEADLLIMIKAEKLDEAQQNIFIGSYILLTLK